MTLSEYMDASSEALNAISEDLAARINSLEYIGGDNEEYAELTAKRDAIQAQLDDNFLGNIR